MNWRRLLHQSNLTIYGYAERVRAYRLKFHYIISPFDLVYKKNGSNRIQTNRLKQFFRFVGMKPGHRARFLTSLMELGVEDGRWEGDGPLSEKQQIRLWKPPYRARAPP